MPTLLPSALKKLRKLKKRQLKKRPKKKQQIKLSKKLRGLGKLLEPKKYRIRLQLQPHPKQTQEVLTFLKVKDHDPLAPLGVLIYANSSRNCMNSS